MLTYKRPLRGWNWQRIVKDGTRHIFLLSKHIELALIFEHITARPQHNIRKVATGDSKGQSVHVIYHFSEKMNRCGSWKWGSFGEFRTLETHAIRLKHVDKYLGCSFTNNNDAYDSFTLFSPRSQSIHICPSPSLFLKLALSTSTLSIPFPKLALSTSR